MFLMFFSVNLYILYFFLQYGSMAMAWCSEHLAVPKLEWIGVFPSEFDGLGDILKGLSAADKKKVDCLKSRDYLPKNYYKELDLMARQGRKAEIEDIESPSKYIWEMKLKPLEYHIDFKD